MSVLSWSGTTPRMSYALMISDRTDSRSGTPTPYPDLPLGDLGCSGQRGGRRGRTVTGMSDSGWVILIVVGSIIALATLAGAIVLLVKVFRTRKLLSELGTGGNVAFWVAVAYTIFPIDLIPDPIYLDDIGVLAGTLVYLTRMVQKKRAERQVELPNVQRRVR